MNIFCSPEHEREFIEAMNTLENEKIKETEKNNLNNNYNQLKYSSNQNISLTKRESSINEFKHNLKKSLSILEIIDYPFKQNSRKKSKIHLQDESNITDKNGETELLIEYTKNYMNVNNFGNKLVNENNNIILNNNNFEKLKIKKVSTYNTNNNNDSISNCSNETVIINNDYNQSNISVINICNNKIYSKDNSSILNKPKITNFKKNGINNSFIRMKLNNTKNSNYLSNKFKKIKKSIQTYLTKNEPIHNYKLLKNTSTNSIPYIIKSYSNDTYFSQDIFNKSKNGSINLINITKDEDIIRKNKKIKEKIKDIPSGKIYKKNIIKNNKNKERKNIYLDINNINNKKSHYKNNIKRINENKTMIGINKNYSFNAPTNGNKIDYHSKTKKLCLSNSTNNKSINQIFKRFITNKPLVRKNYKVAKIKPKIKNNICFYSKKNIINYKFNLLTFINNKIINKKKIKSNASDGEKIKNIQIFPKNLSSLHLSNFIETSLTKKANNDHKNIIKEFY